MKMTDSTVTQRWDVAPPCPSAGSSFLLVGVPSGALTMPRPPCKRQPGRARCSCQDQGLEKLLSCLCVMQALQTLPCPGWWLHLDTLLAHLQGPVGCSVGRGGQGHPGSHLADGGRIGSPLWPRASSSGQGQLPATQDLGPECRPSVFAPGLAPGPQVCPAVSDTPLPGPTSHLWALPGPRQGLRPCCS